MRAVEPPAEVAVGVHGVDARLHDQFEVLPVFCQGQGVLDAHLVIEKGRLDRCRWFGLEIGSEGFQFQQLPLFRRELLRPTDWSLGAYQRLLATWVATLSYWLVWVLLCMVPSRGTSWGD